MQMVLKDITGKTIPEPFSSCIELVSGRLSAVPGVVSIMVCGSVARGWADGYSDLDIHVVCESIPSESARRDAYAGFGPPLALSTLKVTEDYSCDDEFDIHQGGDRVPVFVDFETYRLASVEVERMVNIEDTSEGDWHNASLLQDGVIVHDSERSLNFLRDRIHPMPDPARRFLVAKAVERMTNGYEMECAKKGTLRGDVFASRQHLLNLISATAHVCLHYNGIYYPGDKNLQGFLSRCNVLPDGFIERLIGIISDSDGISAFREWLRLAHEVLDLLGDCISDEQREIALQDMEWVSKPDWRP